MERHILKYSYLAGVVCVAIALLWRLANQFGIYLGNYVPGVGIGYMTFYKAALLFLLAAIASGLVIQTQSAKS
jgi:hypothetical protein